MASAGAGEWSRSNGEAEWETSGGGDDDGSGYDSDSDGDSTYSLDSNPEVENIPHADTSREPENTWADDDVTRPYRQPWLWVREWQRHEAEASRKQIQAFCAEILAKTGEQQKNDPVRAPQQDLATEVAVMTVRLASMKKRTAGDVIREFTRLKSLFPEESYKAKFFLAGTAGRIVAPLLHPVFQTWKPLRDPALWLDVAGLLKNVLEVDGPRLSPYARLIDDTVVPAVQASEWKYTDPDQMLRFLTAWKDALPQPAVRGILEKIVMPELADAVASWDPRCAWNANLHIFLQPWVPLAGPLLESRLYDAVRQKLEKGVWDWDDTTVDALVANRRMLSPWKALFTPESWELLLGRIKVAPNLRLRLRRVEITLTPPKHKDDAFLQVMKWAPFVPPQGVVWLLEAEFFGRWLGALRGLRAASGPSTDEAVAWCKGWKRLFTVELLADELVKARFQAGFDMVSRAAAGLEI